MGLQFSALLLGYRQCIANSSAINKSRNHGLYFFLSVGFSWQPLNWSITLCIDCEAFRWVCNHSIPQLWRYVLFRVCNNDRHLNVVALVARKGPVVCWEEAYILNQLLYKCWITLWDLWSTVNSFIHILDEDILQSYFFFTKKFWIP